LPRSLRQVHRHDRRHLGVVARWLDRRDIRLRAVREQELHRRNIVRIGGAKERRRAAEVNAQVVTMYVVYHRLRFSRTFGSACALSSACISSRYVVFCCRLKSVAACASSAPLLVQHGVEWRRAGSLAMFGFAPRSMSSFARS